MKHLFTFFCLLLTAIIPVLAQEAVLVKTDGTVLRPITIVEVKSSTVVYKFGVNPKKRTEWLDDVAYVLDNGKRTDHNPLKKGVKDPALTVLNTEMNGAFNQFQKPSVPNQDSNGVPANLGKPTNATTTNRESGTDKILFHNGKTINCVINSIGTNQVSYHWAGESTTYSTGKASVYSILFSSGRIEVINERVEVRGSNDWERVQLTDNPEDVVGLVRLGEVKGKSTGGFIGVKKVDAAATRKLKKEAAEMKGHVILLLQDKTSSAGLFTSSKSFKTGIVYGYE